MRRFVRPAHVSALLFASAVVSSLFFHGFQIEFLCLAQALLLLAAGLALWQSREDLTVPATAAGVSLTLYWAWLGLSLAWTQVPAIGVLNFWWMGSLPLAFWLYTLTRDRDSLWRTSAIAMLGVGAVLAAYAVFQLLVQQQPPRSVFININSHAALLNLLLLPLLGFFVLAPVRSRALGWGLGACLFLLAYALAITRGRAAIVAFGVSVGFFFWAAYPHVGKRRAVAALGLIAAAFVMGNISAHGELMSRLESLSNPTSAGATRFVIWQQAWAMVVEQPWWGRGLGTFSLAYPPYRLPSDSSAGAFVHNDYLQLWIETGLPGAVLFVAVWVTLAVGFWRARRRALAGAARIEIAALTGGLLAIALHGFFDFNFYQVPILLIAGLMLGRVQTLIHAAPATRSVRPARWFSAVGYRIVVMSVLAVPLVYFAATIAGAYAYRHALALAETGDLTRADRAFARAMRLAPAGDNIAISRADLYRHALRLSPELPRDERQRWYADALAWLAHAEAQNPLRPLVFLTRGLLYAENAALAGDRWREQAIENYAAALRVDPRFYAARVAYAELLLRTGDSAGARTVLEEGLRHWYLDYEAIVPYYALTAKLRRQVGDASGAAALEERIKLALTNSGWRWVPRPHGAPVLVSGGSAAPAR